MNIPKPLMRLIDRVINFSAEINDRRLFIFASSGAYYIFMGIVPFTMLMCSLLPYTPFSQDLVLSYVDQYIDSSFGKIIHQIVTNIYDSSAKTMTLSILLMLFSTSSATKAIISGIDAAYDFKRSENFIIYNIRAVVYMIFFMALLISTLAFLVYGEKIVNMIKEYLPSISLENTLLADSHVFLSIGILFVFFFLMFNIVPAKRVRILWQIPGAVFSAVMWVLFSSVFSWYVSVSNKYGAYGMIGTIMVAMLWVCYCFLFTLVGGLINSLLYKRHLAKKTIVMPEKVPEN